MVLQWLILDKLDGTAFFGADADITAVGENLQLMLDRRRAFQAHQITDFPE